MEKHFFKKQAVMVNKLEKRFYFLWNGMIENFQSCMPFQKK